MYFYVQFLIISQPTSSDWPCITPSATPLRPLQDSLLSTVLYLIRVMHCLFRKFCICDEAAFLSLWKLSLMYRSSDGAVTSGLPHLALDTTDPVSGPKCKCKCIFFGSDYFPD